MIFNLYNHQQLKVKFHHHDCSKSTIGSQNFSYFNPLSMPQINLNVISSPSQTKTATSDIKKAPISGAFFLSKLSIGCFCFRHGQCQVFNHIFLTTNRTTTTKLKKNFTSRYAVFRFSTFCEQ